MLSAAASAMASLAAPAFAQEKPVTGSVAQTDQAGAETGDANFGEIIVTATRRAQRAQSVPLALTAVGSEQLRSVGATAAADLTRIAPGLNVTTDISAGSPRYSLRGVTAGDLTAGSSPAVSTYIDDVQQAAIYGVGASLFDLGRVEILRGPQGTTFGKNTTAGAVNFFSQTPTDRPEGYINGRLGGGDRPERFVEGAINVPINDTLASRFSFRADQQSDWLRDRGPIGGKRGGGTTFSGRAQLQWKPDSLTTVNLIGYLAQRRGDPGVGRAIQFRPAGGLDVVNYPIAPSTPTPKSVAYTDNDLADDFDNTAVTLRIQRNLGAFDLTSITHFRQSKQYLSQDIDGSAFDLFFYRANSKARQYGQEFRLTSDSTRPLSGLLGAYFEHDNLDENAAEASTSYGLFPGLNGGNGPFTYFTPFAPIPLYDYNTPGYFNTKTQTYALFGNLTYKLTSSLSVTGGLRKTWERKQFRGDQFYYVSGNIDWEHGNILFDPRNPPAGADEVLKLNNGLKAQPWTWDATVNFNPNRDLLVFARTARGFRSGGFNLQTGIFPWSPYMACSNAAYAGSTFCPPRQPTTAPPSYKGETLTSYEIGIKTSPIHGLQINATAFHYLYEKQQVSTFVNGVLFTTNAGTSKVDGAEVEIIANPTSRIDLRANLSYTNARYSNFVSIADQTCNLTPTPSYCTAPFGNAVLTGNRLNQAPRWNGNFEVGYVAPIGANYQARISGNATYRTNMFYSQYNVAPESDKSRFIGNLRLAFSPVAAKGFSIAGYVNNITNKIPLTYAFAAPAPYAYIQYYGFGRTFGLDLSYRW